MTELDRDFFDRLHHRGADVFSFRWKVSRVKGLQDFSMLITELIGFDSVIAVDPHVPGESYVSSIRIGTACGYVIPNRYASEAFWIEFSNRKSRGALLSVTLTAPLRDKWLRVYVREDSRAEHCAAVEVVGWEIENHYDPSRAHSKPLEYHRTDEAKALCWFLAAPAQFESANAALDRMDRELGAPDFFEGDRLMRQFIRGGRFLV